VVLQESGTPLGRLTSLGGRWWRSSGNFRDPKPLAAANTLESLENLCLFHQALGQGGAQWGKSQRTVFIDFDQLST